MVVLAAVQSQKMKKKNKKARVWGEKCSSALKRIDPSSEVVPLKYTLASSSYEVNKTTMTVLLLVMTQLHPSPSAAPS